jgi:GNAT superfamily N-acetyltransferase
MVRDATTADIPELVRLGSLSLVNGPYAGMIKDTPEQSAKLALEVIENAKGKVLIYENDTGRVVGLLGFIIFAHYFTGEPTANEIMWYVEPEERKGGGGMKLLWEAERQAKEMGAKYMSFSAPNVDVANIYERFGYKQLEVSFVKELDAVH